VLATLARLNTEWAELAQTSAPTVAEWVRRCPQLEPAADLGHLLDVIRARPDDAMRALLELGRAGEPLAWRVVLQAMLGKVVLLCRSRPERFDEAVSELWLAIAEYPLERRPRSIAANLGWMLRRWLAEASRVPGPQAAVHRVGATAEDTLVAARRLELIDAETHRTLWLVYVAGLTSARAAAELGTTSELVRYRCSHTLRRLAGHAELLSA
jgi:DNA-directed RNA polymerase specialized sigma24 family protein